LIYLRVVGLSALRTDRPLAFGTRLDDSPQTVATTVGRPLGGVEVYIRSADGDSARQGRAGRIFLRSPAMMRGYWNDPEMTAQSVSNDGWLATGDLGVLDDQGNLVCGQRRIQDRHDAAASDGCRRTHGSFPYHLTSVGSRFPFSGRRSP
jgi:acyl-CoA synthetase (AMP-forming)/AMP-acid ligase II